MSALPLWVLYLQALSLPALALLGAIIAYRQWRTAYDRLRLDLFDRRFDIYVEAQKFLGKVIGRGFPEHEEFAPLWRARDRATFLLGPEVTELLKKINDTAAGLQATHRMMADGIGEKRQKAAAKNHELITEFATFDDELTRRMRLYLRFHEVAD